MSDLAVRPSPTRATHPSPDLVRHQSRHEIVSMRREPVALFFSLAFPLLFFVILSALFGNETMDSRSGVRLAQFLLPAMASFGIVMATFSNLAIGMAEARETGVLKRLRGTPLSPAALIAARVVAGTVVALLAVGLLVATALAVYEVQIAWRAVPGTLLTLGTAIVAFSALGLAVAAVAPSAQAALTLSTGVVVPLAFISDVFAFGAQLPSWLNAIGWFFPLRHLVNALADATNPFHTTWGIYPDHLAVLAAWGLFGALVAARRLSVEPHRTRLGHRGRRARPARPAGVAEQAVAGKRTGRDAVARVGRPSLRTLLFGEVRHANHLLWRDPGSAFFAVGFPLLLTMLIPQIYGKDTLLADGTPLAQFYAPTMMIYGAAVAAYVNMPEALARARERGVLQRVAGTPLPLPTLVLSRTVSAVWIALVGSASVALATWALYDVPWPGAWLAALVTLLLSTACFAVLGLALMSLTRTSRTVSAVGLGTLLPLSFVSDIFLINAEFPSVLNAIGWTFPLRHATRAMTDAYAVGATGWGLAWGHLAVITAWLLAGLAVVLWRARTGHLTRRR